MWNKALSKLGVKSSSKRSKEGSVEDGEKFGRDTSTLTEYDTLLKKPSTPSGSGRQTPSPSYTDAGRSYDYGAGVGEGAPVEEQISPGRTRNLLYFSHLTSQWAESESSSNSSLLSNRPPPSSSIESSI